MGVVTTDGEPRSAGGSEAHESLADWLGLPVAEVRSLLGNGELVPGIRLRVR